MKKSLSLLLALAMVFGMFASMASAADSELTTAQKLQQLVDNGVLKGKPDGLPHLEDSLTRAEFATIAVAIAGLAPSTSTTSAFKDVKVGEWWTSAIQAAYEAGLVDGVGNSLFSPKANVTVESVIKVAVTIAKLTPVEGATVSGASDWAGPYIQAAIDAGLPVPSNYTANATRGQTIELAYEVFQSLQVKPLVDVKAVVNADDTISVTGTTYGADSVKVAIGTAEAAAATLADDGTFKYTTEKQAVGTYTLTVTAYKGTTVLGTATASATVDSFAVASATVLNGKQIAITFTKPVQFGTASGGHNNLAYYSLGFSDKTIAPTAADLSTDGLTLTLSFYRGFDDKNSNSNLNAYAQLYVSSSLQSAGGKALAEYKQAILLNDSTAPTVSGVTYSGGAAKLTFSEPLSSLGTISINGTQLPYGSIYATTSTNTAATYGGDITAVTIYGLTPDTSYTVNVVGGVDTAGNYFDYSGTLLVADDSSIPTVTSVTVNGSTVTVKYSEAISTSAAGYIYNSDDSTVSTSGTVDGDDATIVTYDLSGWVTGTFKTFNAKVRGYTDLVGNAGKDYSVVLTIAKDTTGPVYQSVVYETGIAGYTYGVVVFKFDEKVTNVPTSLDYTYTNSSSLVTPGTLTRVSTTNTGYDIDHSSAVDSDEYNYVAYAPAATLGNGTYSITLPASFTDVSGNVSTKTTASLTVNTAAGNAVLTSSISAANPVTGAVTPGVIYFTFSEKLTSAALNLNNFTINGSALPTGTTLVFDGNMQTIKASLPAGAIGATGNRLIKVANVVSENGNTLNTSVASYYSNTISLIENVKPVANSITVSNDQTLTVNFSEALAAASTGNLATDGITVLVNGNQATTTTWTYRTSGSSLIISAPEGTFTSTQTYVVKFASGAVKDSNGNSVAESQVTK